MANETKTFFHIGDTEPTVARDGLRVGDCWIDKTNNAIKKCIALSPVTWSTELDIVIAGDATATPTASKIPIADGSGKLDGWVTLPLRAVVTSQFDKTNDAALANVTGLSVNIVTGKTYIFRAVLFVDANVTGGHQYAVSGTATASAIKYQVNAFSNTTNLSVINSRQTAL